MTEMTFSPRKIFRKSLVIPAEHGAWAWLLVPFAPPGLSGEAI